MDKDKYNIIQNPVYGFRRLDPIPEQKSVDTFYKDSYYKLIKEGKRAPDIRRLDLFAISGCMGGDMLMGIDAEGRVNACSFAEPEPWDVLQLGDWWADRKAFRPFRSWGDGAPEPCASCAYLRLCRGGCRVVALAMQGSMTGADPGCPLVRANAGSLSSDLSS